MGAQAGLTFFREIIEFRSRNGTLACGAHKPRIVTINNIDGVSGLIKAHTRWPKKYPSIFYQILSPPFGCNEPIMSPSKIYLRFSYIEKTFKKALQKLVDFCMVFWKFLTKLVIFSLAFQTPSTKCFVFSENPDSSTCTEYFHAFPFSWAIVATLPYKTSWEQKYNRLKNTRTAPIWTI